MGQSTYQIDFWLNAFRGSKHILCCELLSRSQTVDADIDIMGAVAVPDLKQGFVPQCLKSDQCCNFSGTSDVSPHHT
jgi:hypothetical protein